MSRPTCAAKTCYNSHYNKPLLKFFHFPNDENRSRQWIKHSGRDDLYDVPLDKLSKKYFLCADHFDAKWFLHPKFKTKFKSYVEPIPTIFLNNFTEFLPKSVQNKLLTKVVDGEQASNLNEELNKESKIESVWIDEEKLCRLCASYVFSNEYKNIFSESNSHLKDMIEYLLPEMVSEDELPHDVCNSCEVKVKECIDTILGFEEVYKCLKKTTEDKLINVNERQDINTSLNGAKNHKNVKESYSNNDSYTGENESGISVADEGATQFCKAQIADGSISKSIMLKCSYCTAEFNSHNSLKCHEKQIHLQFKKHHSQSQINNPVGGTKCIECNKTMSPDKIRVHMASHKPKENQCEYCGMQYKTKRRLDNHLISHLGDPFCSFCGKEFNNVSQKRLHEKTHIENKNPEFLCYICGRLFTDQQALDDHIKNHDKINAYDCNICNKTFNTESLLKLHLDSYSKYSCPICGKEFHLKARVQQHLLTHSGVSPFTCFCGVAFNRSGNLTQHIKLRHSNESNEKGTKQIFQCSVCNRKLKSKVRLKWHLAKHAGDKKPYDCEHCDKKYASIFKYKNHLRTHTGERPFACTYCSRTFSSKANMKQHELIHQDIYPHRCMTCDRVFKRIQSLIIHKRTHTGERPFVCPVCNKGFLQKYDLQKHMKTHNKQSNGSDQSLNSLLSSNLIDMPDLQTLASVNVVPPGTSSSSLQLFSVNDISQLTLTGADLQILNMPIVEIQPLM